MGWVKNHYKDLIIVACIGVFIVYGVTKIVTWKKAVDRNFVIMGAFQEAVFEAAPQIKQLTITKLGGNNESARPDNAAAVPKRRGVTEGKAKKGTTKIPPVKDGPAATKKEGG